MKAARYFAAIFIAFCCLIPNSGAQTEHAWIALTFDDGPAGKITEQLLDELDRQNIPATFFLCCYRIQQYPDTVRRMAQAGHETGIHGCSHLYFTQMTETQLQDEISCTAKAIRDLTGTAPSLLRPPGGLYNEAVRQAAKKADCSILLWSVDPEDWNPVMRKKAANHVIKNAKHGDIILLHDLSKENTAAVLDIINGLKKRGFRFCTVSELAAKAGTTLTPGNIYRRFF